MLETRHSNIEFLGKDGFQWFIAQVAPDKVWRDYNNQNFDNGFRAKIRILGYHPAESEGGDGISDENLPWAHFLVSPQFGAGNNYTGTAFSLQGGEMVVGFFLDGEEGQQPVVLGAFYANYNITDLISYKEELEKGTTGFKALEIDPNIKYGDHIQIKKQVQILKSGGVVDSDKTVRDKENKKKKTIEHHFDNKSYHIPQPEVCTNPIKKTGEIAKTLQKFFDRVNELEQFSDGWIDPVVNKIVDMNELIDDASQEISGAMSGVIRTARFEMFKEINSAVDEAVDFLTPDFLEKSIEAKKQKDGIFCAIENILNGLKKVIGDFLKGLLGNILNIPLCAAEQFLSGLMSKLTNSIQNMISPLLSGLSKFTGKAMPTFQSMMAKAMGIAAAALSLFECEGQQCDPNPTDFLTNVGNDKKKQINKNSLLSKFTTLSGSGLVGGITDLVGLSFPNIPNIGGIGDAVGSFAGGSPLEGLVSGCNVSSKKCGPPRIEIFGGGGIGAVADAVINETGNIIGVNMKDFGIGYTEPPYVAIIDDCENGKGATGVATIDDEGQVTNISILEDGGGYLSNIISDEFNSQVTSDPSDPTTTSDLDPSDPSVPSIADSDSEDVDVKPPSNVSDTEGVDVIGEIVDATIISSGANYEEGDLVVSSETGQAFVPVIEDGRIVGVEGSPIDQGLTQLPELIVETNTGFGAQLLPITKFVKREEYTDPIVPEAELITVISCPRFY